MKRIISGMLAVAVSCTLSGATIDWEDARDITSDADVCTDGVLCYAYKAQQGDATLNGVTFKGWGVANAQTTLESLNWTIAVPYNATDGRTGARDPFLVFYNLRECRVDSTFLIDGGGDCQLTTRLCLAVRRSTAIPRRRP